MYKAKVPVGSEIRTKHSKQSEHHVEFLNVRPGDKKRNREALKVQKRTSLPHNVA
jgi:desulfoferrodoxin (superoxide reductase-like protein)